VIRPSLTTIAAPGAGIEVAMRDLM